MSDSSFRNAQWNRKQRIDNKNIKSIRNIKSIVYCGICSF